MPAFVMPGYDPDRDSPGAVWFREHCAPDLQRYHCRHGRYIGFMGIFVDSCELCRPAEQTYEVDVTYSTHERVKEGRTAIGCERVTVLAADEADAMLVACQLVASTLHVMPTMATLAA